MENWVQKAIAQWKEEGLELNQGASIADIEEVEQQIGYKFPNDFKELYTIVNGFVDFEMRGFMLSLWSLERIVENHPAKNKNFIMISDFSFSVCQYGFDKKREGVFKGFYGELIAKSFQELIELINCDAEVLF